MQDSKTAWPPVRLPFVAMAVVAGIWFGGETPWRAELAPWLMMALVAFVATRRRAAARWIAVAALIAAGLGARARVELPAPDGIGIDDRESDVVDGWVSGPIVATRSGVSFGIDRGGVRMVVRAEHHGGILPGDHVRLHGRVTAVRGFRNPGAADRVLAAQAAGTRWEVRARSIERLDGARLSLWRWPAAIARAASATVAARGGDATGNALVRGAVLGDRSAIDEDTDAAWRAAGVYHALSVSGLHLAAVALVVFALVGWSWALLGLGAWLAPRRAAAAVALPMALAYTLVTGAQIATVRALLVVGVVLLGELIGRRARAADALGFAAIVVLLLTPLALHDPGFQLSFVATATLIIAAAPRSADPALATHPSRPRRILAALVRGLVTSTAVALATAPITAWHFHEIALGGAVGNLFVTPLVELVTIPLGLAGLALAWSPAGGVVLDLAVLIAGLTADLVAALGARTPSLIVPPPSGLELLACATLYAAWACARTGRSRGRTALAVATLAVAVLAASWAARVHARASDDTLRITFLDVGQGDAAVIELPGGEVWLVDAGGAPGIPGSLRASARPGEEIARFLRARRIDRVAVAIISHPHPDHYLGLLALAPRVDIDELWSAAEPDDAQADDADFAQLRAWLADDGVRAHVPLRGAYHHGDVTVRVLAPVYDPGDGPDARAAADPVRSVNDNSLVLSVERAGRCVLFTGDLEHEGEEALVDAAGGALPCDVVKVAHHGSATSSSPALIAATRPALAVMSLGRGNRFGFPAAEVVARWRAAGAAVLRTDEAGAVTVTIDRAGTLQIATQDPP